MKYYFVAKNKGGGFVGQRTVEDITNQFRAGEIPGDYVVTESFGPSYAEVLKLGSSWITVAELVANPPIQPVPGLTHPQASVTTVSSAVTSKQLSALMQRYYDAYLVARAVNGYGISIKILGVVAASVLCLLGIVVIANGRNVEFAMGVAAITFGLFVGILFYLIGVLISAQGQILKASLDSAVNNSPFLENEHRAKIMSLPDA